MHIEIGGAMIYFLKFTSNDWRTFKAQIIGHGIREKLKIFIRTRAQKDGQQIREEIEKELDILFLDMGGSISLNSAKIEFSVGAVRFGMFVHQLPVLFHCLSTALEEFEPLTGYVTIKGLHDVYSLIPIEMRDEMLLILQKLTLEYSDQILEEAVKLERVSTDIKRHTGAIKHKTIYANCDSNKKIKIATTHQPRIINNQ